MKAKLEIGTIISNEPIAIGIYSMDILAPNIIKEVERPGQFINLYPKEKHTILPRPISICNLNIEKDIITIVYEVVGDGTGQFSQMVKGDKLKISGPIGNGFVISEEKGQYLLVGGGVGVPPLLELAKRLHGNIIAVLGFRQEPILVKEFEKLGVTVYVATENGKYGHRGNVLDILNEKEINVGMAYSCGPKPMLKALNMWCQERNIPVQVSLEERMACGIGVCVGCVCKQKDKSSEDGWSYKKTCTDGPVFMGSEVMWDE